MFWLIHWFWEMSNWVLPNFYQNSLSYLFIYFLFKFNLYILIYPQEQSQMGTGLLDPKVPRWIHILSCSLELVPSHSSYLLRLTWPTLVLFFYTLLEYSWTLILVLYFIRLWLPRFCRLNWFEPDRIYKRSLSFSLVMTFDTPVTSDQTSTEPFHLQK